MGSSESDCPTMVENAADHTLGSNQLFLLRGLSLVIFVVVFQVAAARLQLDREAKRRFQHAVTGHALVQVSYYLPVSVCILALSIGSAGIWYIRMYQAEAYFQHFGPLLRPHELENDNLSKRVLPGAFYFLLGTTMTAILFPMPIARYAVECLSLADPIAAWVGQSVTSPKLLPKHSSASLAGTVACFLVAWCIGYFMLVRFAEDETSISLSCVTLSAFVCCLAEAFPVGNDNLSIPILTALAVKLSLDWM